MILHPVSYFILALDLVIAILVLPPLYGAASVAVILCALAVAPGRTGTRIARPFMKLFAVGTVFLFLIHAVTWHPVGISPDGLVVMCRAVARIGAVIAAVTYLAGRVTGNELYALMIDLRVPPAAILILFRTLWLVPRFMERIDEVILAQRLRGMRLEGFRDRTAAVLPALTPVFASMLDETWAHAMTMTIRGFLEPGRKTHRLALPFRGRDGAVAVAGIAAAILMLTGGAWF